MVNDALEIFDPYLSSFLSELHLKNIRVNGTAADDFSTLIKEIAFDDINHDGFSTGAGKIEKIIVR